MRKLMMMVGLVVTAVLARGASAVPAERMAELWRLFYAWKTAELESAVKSFTAEQLAGGGGLLLLQGVMAEWGCARECDPALAYSCYERSAAAGTAAARPALARLRLVGFGCERDEAKARAEYAACRETLNRAADGGSPWARLQRGECRLAFEGDWKSAEDDFLAVAAADLRVGKGVPEKLVFVYLSNRIALEYGDEAHARDAIMVLEGLAEDGLWMADADLLAWYLADGRREDAARCVGRSGPRIGALARCPARAEYAYLVSQCAREGIGGDKNPANAHAWLIVAAKNGYAPAQVELGMALLQGQEGVKADPAAAVGWFRKAAEQNDASACLALSECYARGLGVAGDPDEAARWYADACELAGIAQPESATKSVGDTLARFAALERGGNGVAWGEELLRIRASGSAAETYALGIYLGSKRLARDAVESFGLAERRYTAEIAAGVRDDNRPPIWEIQRARNLCLGAMSGQLVSSWIPAPMRPRRHRSRREPRQRRYCDVVDLVSGPHGPYYGRRCPKCSAPFNSLYYVGRERDCIRR